VSEEGGPSGAADAGASSPPLGEQAGQLLAVVQDWVRRNFEVAGDAEHAAVCDWCPLCQFVAVLRGDRPEVTERVAAAGTAVTAALRAVLDAATEGPRDSGTDSGPRVHKIDLDT
jgi:hypothetical protein